MFRSALWCAALLAGCSSGKKDAYETFAREANPTLTALRPAVSVILGNQRDNPTETEKRVAACTSVTTELTALEGVHADNEGTLEIGTERDEWAITSIAHAILGFERFHLCPGTDPQERRQCSEVCVEYFTKLVHAVETLRTGAKRADIDIVSLTP